MMRITVPVFGIAPRTYSVDVVAEVDETGDIWLSPEQTDELERARSSARFFEENLRHAGNEIQGSKKLSPRTVRSLAAASFSITASSTPQLR